MPALVGLLEVKEALNMSPGSGPNDGELTRTLAAAVEAVEGYVGPITEQEVTETHRQPGSALVLRKTPVLGVDSVVGLGGGAVPYGSAQLDVDAESGVVRPLWGDSFGSFDAPWGGVTVTYRAGRPAGAVPAVINQAILIVVEHLWATQRGWATTPSWRGDQSAEPDQSDGRPMGFALPSRAMQLIEGETRIVVG